MISSVTMPAYFCKEKLQNEVINESTDLEFFLRVIASDIGIGERFVGEEPTDGYTAEYNRRMHEICEANGILVREIPRKTSNDRPISASEVRRCIKARDLARLKELVPEGTYQFLCKEYF